MRKQFTVKRYRCVMFSMALLGGLGLAGCGSKAPSPEETAAANDPQKAAAAAQAGAAAAAANQQASQADAAARRARP